MVGLLLSGCTLVGPDYQQPGLQNLSSEFQPRDFQQQPTQELDDWWRSFADPTLDQLVGQALSSNLTVQIAAERIVQARANANLNGANFLPTVDSITSYEYRKRSPNARPFVGQNGNPFQLFNLGLDSSWEIDLFGRLERSLQAAEAELIAQEFSLQDVQQTLVADVASSYLTIRLLQDQLHTVERSIELQQETTTVVNGRAKAGVATKLDSEQTVAFLHRTGADKAALELQLDVEFNRLSILLGESPGSPLRDFVGFGPIPDAPYLPAAGIPADLIRRRPDVRQAEAVVVAATARIGIATADLYPTLSLLGTIGVSAQDVSALFQTDSLLFNVGPSFRWNILHFGRINDNIEIQESLTRQAVGSYRLAVLDAVKEVEDSMAKYEGFQKQLAALESAVQSDAKAVDLSLQRYEMGKSNFQRVLDVQVQLLQDAQAVAAARANANIQLIRLYKAVGGGWPGRMGAAAGRGCAECEAGNQLGCQGGCMTSDQLAGHDVNYQQTQAHPTKFETIISSEVIDSGTTQPNGLNDSGFPNDPIQDVPSNDSPILNSDSFAAFGIKNTLASTWQSDFSKRRTSGQLNFTPDLGQAASSKPPSGAAGKAVMAEMFDWDANRRCSGEVICN